VIEDGAIFDGLCTMTRTEQSPAEAAGRPASVQPLHSLRKDR
jgi:hypothetical protein